MQLPKLIAAEPAPLGKVSKVDLKKVVLSAALIGGLSTILPMLSASSVTIIMILKAFGIGFATGGIGELIRRLSTNSEDQFGIKEPK